EGDLGEGHNWDDAHLQVTLLAAFHAGQKSNAQAMFYEGSFTDKVYDQINKIGKDSRGKPINACVYKQGRNPQLKAVRAKLEKRDINLTDYWQFNKECKRSGVNMTRSDFSKMGTEITDALASGRPAVVKAARRIVGAKEKNVISGVAELFINDDAPSEYSPAEVAAMTKAIVDFVMQSYADAHEITLALAK
ncbi:MAG: hypothetical protein K2X47_09430, partial [Bdellovibrionales bacterium]|nr:hypothetical protein [Bdellovibrionales bacterium]